MVLMVEYGVLGAVGLLAGMIDTIGGGGGLLTVPALLIFGLPPMMVLGTNKLQASAGTGVAIWRFWRAGNFNGSSIWRGAVAAFLSAIAGTWVVLQMHPHHIRAIIPPLLLLVLFYMVFVPRSGLHPGRARWPMPRFFITVGSALGFYDGFLGPGTGSFWVASMIVGLGWDIKQATIHAKLYNFISNIAALLLFIGMGYVNYRLGLIMVIGQWVGASMGAHIVLKSSTRFIRPFFIGILMITLVVLCYNTYLH